MHLNVFNCVSVSNLIYSTCQNNRKNIFLNKNVFLLSVKSSQRNVPKWPCTHPVTLCLSTGNDILVHIAI